MKTLREIQDSFQRVPLLSLNPKISRPKPMEKRSTLKPSLRATQ